MSAPTGRFTDSRDGRVYKTVLMPDGKWWLAENLDWSGSGSDCLHTPQGPRSTYGRFYNYADGMSAVIPGSHMPSEAEWAAMLVACGGVWDGTKYPEVGIRLKANSTLWDSCPGTDNFGFSALPAGSETPPEPYGYTPGSVALFQSETTSGGQVQQVRLFDHGDPTSAFLDLGFVLSVCGSVRLIVDSGNIPDTAPAPTIYPASGTLQGVQLVVIQGQGTIRYTLDGSEPTASSPVYTGPFRLAYSAAVKAKAFQNSLSSDTVTSVLVIQGADFLKIPSYTAHVLPYLLEQYKGDNP